MNLLLQIVGGLYLTIGVLFWALELGYSREKELQVLLCWLYIGFWPLVIAYQTGETMGRRK